MSVQASSDDHRNGRRRQDGHPYQPTIKGAGFSSTDGIFFAAVEMTRMPMILTDPNRPDNPVVFANAAFIDLTGYELDEILGRNCRFLQGPESDAKTIAEVRAAVAQHDEIATEILNYRKDGSAFWNALYISPVFGHDGALLYFFASQLDVTRRRDAEEALRQAQKMEAVGQLTGGIAHDFNNMLTVILGNLEGAIDDGTEQRQRRKLERAIEAAERAERLTQQLLAFARKQRLDGRPTNLNTLISTWQELVDRAVGRDVEISTEFAPDLWTARVDAVQAELAILNVLLNARDAMPRGGQVVIRTANRSVTPASPEASELDPGDYVELAITDSGTGIPSDLVQRVIEPFFTTKEPGKGSGMGLAMVYGFMRQSEGHLVIDSRQGQGTTIRLFFPALQRAEEPMPVLRQSAAMRGGSERILVVEDNPDVRDLAQAILADLGYRVTTADDGRQALDLLDCPDGFALLFSDLVMPGGLGGLELARLARDRQPGLKVLLTTGYADRVDGEADVARSGFELIGKPYRRSELARRIRIILDGHTGVT